MRAHRNLYCLAHTDAEREDWIRAVRSVMPERGQGSSGAAGPASAAASTSLSAAVPRPASIAKRMLDGRTGSWEITAVIGEGAYAEVRLGLNMGDRTKVAVKIIRNEEPGSGMMTRLKREIDYMRRVNHPNVIRVRFVFFFFFA